MRGEPRAVVILFDLLNSTLNSRGAVWNAMKTSLAHLPETGSLYLYLLVEDGSLYPVHGLERAEIAAEGDAPLWPNQIGPLLDAAMRKVAGAKPLEERFSPPARFNTTCHALDDMRARMTSVAGPKQLLWVTYGIPSTMVFADRTTFDGGLTLRQIGGLFVKSEIKVYTTDPGISVQNGVLNRDSLDIFTGATGGHTFSTIDLNRALSQMKSEARVPVRTKGEPVRNAALDVHAVQPRS